MMRSEKSSERGQVFVLLVLAVIVLLGFTALAIDGGKTYSNRRDVQKAADAGSLAGASAAGLYFINNNVESDNWSCPGNSFVGYARATAVAEAERLAADNGYSNAQDIVDVTTECGIDQHGGFIDVITNITSDTETSFAHLVYDGQIRNTVMAVSRVRPPTIIGFGNAIVALNPECENVTGGVRYSGDGEITVTDGGIFSNDCMVANGSSSVVEVINGDIACIQDPGEPSCFTPNGSPVIDPWPTDESTDQMLDVDEFYIQPPDCSELFTLDAHSIIVTNGETETVPSGYHTNVTLNNGGHLTLAPGLHCIKNGLDFQGGEVIGNGVTIFIEDGTFSNTGGVHAVLSAPTEAQCDAAGQPYCPPAIEDLLFYLAPGNEGELSVLGDADSSYTGTIYAPDGTVKLGGTANVEGETITYWTQVIADSVRFVGTIDIQIYYEPGDLYHHPTELNLQR